ncbi:MAG: c-type cytochrome [Bryobacterales bacterium]|nr:c-type cytochrome [Bryobacterales bacterium]
MRLLLMLACALHAQRELIPRDAASVDAGKQIYMGSCSGCHGATGEGSQGPSLLSGRASRLPDRTLLGSIKNGLPGTSMPDFPMGDTKVAQVAAYVRSLTSPAIATTVAGDDMKGRELFFGAGRCSSCHMIMGKGGHPGPDLSNIAADRTVPQLRESIAKPSARITDGFRGVSVTLAGGKTVHGVAKNHNNYSLQVLDHEGKLHLINRAQVVNLEWKEQSLMPAIGNAADAQNLIAFLARQAARGKLGGAQ